MDEKELKQRTKQFGLRVMNLVGAMNISRSALAPGLLSSEVRNRRLSPSG